MEIKNITKDGESETVNIVNISDDFVMHITQDITVHVIKSKVTGKTDIFFTTYNDIDEVNVHYSGKDTKVFLTDYEK